MYSIRPIRAFQDNYIWCLSKGNKAVVVDPGDAAPVLDALRDWQLELAAILVTHHHFDHVGGVEKLRKIFPVPVFAPPQSTPHIDHLLHDGDSVTVFDLTFSVMAVPGHTLDHLALYCSRVDDRPVLFCGDTLFAGGCGRLFEGTPSQMLASLDRLAELPAETQVYCAHEYTANNLRFARAVEPDNEALQQREQRVALRRARDEPTVPSVLAEELATNPFLRSREPPVQLAAEKYARMPLTTAEEVFAAVRRWKDEF